MFTIDDLIRECSIVSKLDNRRPSTSQPHSNNSANSTARSGKNLVITSRALEILDSPTSENVFLQVWKALMVFIYEHVSVMQGVTIPKFCTITFAKDSIRAPGGSGNFPVFRLSNKFQMFTKIKSKLPPSVSMPEEAAVVLNFSKLGVMSGLDKDVVKTALFHIISRIAEVIRDGYVVCLEFENIGILHARNNTIDFQFNIGSKRNHQHSEDFAVGNGNATFTNKALSSSIGLELSGLSSSKYASGQSAPDLPPELTPRTLAQLLEKDSENAYKDPSDFASILRKELEATEIAIQKEKNELEKEKEEEEMAIKTKKSPKQRLERPNTVGLTLEARGNNDKPNSSGFKGKAATHLPGLNLAALNNSIPKKAWNVYPAYINPLKEPPRGRITDPIQYDAAQTKAFSRFEDSLLKEIEELDHLDSELERRRKMSEALYREKILRRKNSQEEMNHILGLQAREKNDRDEEAAANNFDDFLNTKVIPIATIKTRSQISSEKNALKTQLFHQMDHKDRKLNLEKRSNKREDQFFLSCIKSQLLDDRIYRKKKKILMNEDLRNNWSAQMKLKNKQNIVQDRRDGAGIVKY